jgi:hypothetical protein
MDGKNYRNVGMSADDLRIIMVNNPECLVQLDHYRNKQTLAMIVAIPAGILIGWPIGGYLGSGGEWEDSYNIMLGVGASLIIVGVIIESSSSKYLEKAVADYNNKIVARAGELRINPVYYQQNQVFGLNVMWRF